MSVDAETAAEGMCRLSIVDSLTSASAHPSMASLMQPRTPGTYRCVGPETSTKKTLFVSWCCRNGPRKVKVKRVPGAHKRHLPLPADRPAVDDAAMDVGGAPQLTRKEALKLAKKREAELVQALQQLQIVETAATRGGNRRRRRFSAMYDGCAEGEAADPGAAGGASSGNGAESRRTTKGPTRLVKRSSSVEEVLVRLKAKKAAQMDIAGGAGDGFTLGQSGSRRGKATRSKKIPRSKPSTCSEGKKRRKKRSRTLTSDPGSPQCVKN